LLKWLSLVLRVLLGVVILAAGLGLVVYMATTRPTPELKPEVFAPMLVRGMVLEPQQLERSWSGYGTARAMSVARVSPQVSALVITRADWLEPGARIQPGQTLFELERVDFELAATSAQDTINALKAQLAGLAVEEQRLARQVTLAEEEEAIARRDLDRARDVIGEGAGSESELDQWTAALRRAERVAVSLRQQADLIPSRRADLAARIEAQNAELEQALEDLARTTITAPIGGIVQSVSLEAGEWAQAGQPAVTIIDLSRIEIPLRVSIEASGLVAIGDAAQIRGKPEDDEFWQGRVSRIAPDADTQTRAMTVYVEIGQDMDAPRLLRPGRFVVGEIYESDTRQRVVVPRSAIKGGRILLAGEPDGTVARVWPLAERVAGTIATRLAAGTTPVTADGRGGSVAAIVEDAARLEVGDHASELAASVTATAGDWLGGPGRVRVQEEIRTALRAALTPEIAAWLARQDPADLPDQLGAEVAQVRDLARVEAVPVEQLFSVERRLPALSDRETQWVVVAARDGRELAGATLLVSNLDQLNDGRLVRVDPGSGR
jgi:multidrug resistance efflux pump